MIDELRREDTPISRNIADHIDSFTDYDFAHLLFSDGTVENAISLDNQLNIIQVADLVLPDKDTTFEEYTGLLQALRHGVGAGKPRLCPRGDARPRHLHPAPEIGRAHV